MKKWAVSDICWANTDDLRLPFWQKWNRENPLPKSFFQRIWEYPYLASKIPQAASSLDIGGTYPFVLFKNFPNAISVDQRNLNKLNHPLHYHLWPKKKLIVSDAACVPVVDNSFDYVFSISALEEMPDVFRVMKEMLRIAKYRVVVTMDVSDILGIPLKKLREFEDFLKMPIPSLPKNALISPLKEYKHIRTLAFTIDSRDEPKSVAILIPHYNSWPFLNLCLTQIQKNRNKRLKETIYVLDDESSDGSFGKAKRIFANDHDIKFLRYRRPNKKKELDIGLLLDYGLKIIKEQYVAMIDADTFSLTKEWLDFPIWLIEKYHCSSVGLDTGLANAYAQKIKDQPWWNPQGGYLAGGGLYDNAHFTCTNNLYRVMNTATAKVVSEKIGFTSAVPHQTIIFKLLNKIRKFLHLTRLNLRYPYLAGGEDNGVAANHFLDINRMGPKFNIPLTSYLGLTPKDGAFGQNISGLLFHFALSRKSAKTEEMGKLYSSWLKKLFSSEEINPQILEEMIKKSSRFQAGGYDGSIPVSWYQKEFNYIQNLLKKYKSEL